MTSARRSWGPAGLDKVGDCVLGADYGDPDDLHGRLRVDRADPIIWVSAEIVERVRVNDHHPDVTVDGDLLTIRASNRTVIYRIGEYYPQRHCYLLTWPD